MTKTYEQEYVQNQAKIIEELKAQKAAMREAFDRLNRMLRHALDESAIAYCDLGFVEEALSLTPSEAAEMIRKRDEALKLAVKTFKHINAVGGCGHAIHGFCDKAIEAARAAGVEV